MREADLLQMTGHSAAGEVLRGFLADWLSADIYLYDATLLGKAGTAYVLIHH